MWDYKKVMFREQKPLRRTTRTNVRMHVLKEKKKKTFFLYGLLLVGTALVLCLLFQLFVFYQFFEELKELGRQNFEELNDLVVLREKVHAATITALNNTVARVPISWGTIALNTIFVSFVAFGVCFGCTTITSASPLGEVLYLYTDEVSRMYWRIHTQNGIIQNMYIIPMDSTIPGYTSPYSYLLALLIQVYERG